MTTRRLTVLVPALLAIVAAFLALRLAPPGGGGEEGGYLAYRVPVGHTLGFHVGPGIADLTLTLHLVAPSFDREATPLRFPVTTSIVAQDGSVLWTGHALVEAAPGGAVADGHEPLTASRVMALPRLDLPAGARLDVTFEPGGDATPRSHAVVRLQPRRATIEHVGSAIRVVQVRTLPHVAPPPPAPDEPGEAIAPDRGAAWTVRGPGRIRLELHPLAPSVAVDLATVDNQGRTTGFTLLAGEVATPVPIDAPAGGAITVTARCAGAQPKPDATATPAPCARVRAFVEQGAAPLGDGVTPDPSGEITPDRRLLPVWRLAAGDPPLSATLEGDGLARVQLRAAGGDATVGWRLLDGTRPLSSGQLTVPYLASPFERAPGDAPAGEPLSFLASAPPGATLELSVGAGTADVSLEAPDDPPASRLAPEYEVPLEHARLRNAPYVRRHWVPFRPDDHQRLFSLGRAIAVAAQVRLEPTGPGGGGGPYVVVVPDPPRTRQLLAEELDDAPPRWRPFHRGAFATNETASLIVPASGQDAGRVALDYIVPAAALGGKLRIWLDGAVHGERHVEVTRGRIRLEDLPPGRHDVRVEGAPGTVLTATATTGRIPWAERAVWRLDRGESLAVPIHLARGGKTLHVVLYSDEPYDRSAPRTSVSIDRGSLPFGLRPAAGHTRMVRGVSPTPLPLRAAWLDQDGGPRSRAHFAIRLSADLGPGTHHVRISLDEGPRRAYARFYVTGAAGEPSVERLGEEWDVD